MGFDRQGSFQLLSLGSGTRSCRFLRGYAPERQLPAGIPLSIPSPCPHDGPLDQPGLRLGRFVR